MSAFFHFSSLALCVSLALCKLQIFSNLKKWLCVLSMHDGYYVNTCVWACHTNYFFLFHLIFSFICSKCFLFLSYLTLFEIYFANVWFSSCLWSFYFLFPYLFRFFSSFTWCILCHIFFILCILCQHLGPTCHLLSLRHFILPWHSQSHFLFTLRSYLYTL